MSLTFSPANEIKTDLTAGLTPQFFRLNLNEQLAALKKLVDTRQLPSYELFLPFVLQLNGKPYTLRDHFAFQTLYRTDCPRVLTVMSGRQVAKCVRISEHNRVALANGRPVAGHELRIGDAVMTMDDNYRAASGVVVDKFDSGLRDVLRITTRLGNVLEVATTHPLRALPGWVASGDLRVGARIAAARRGGAFGVAPLDDRAILTAYMIGDGCCGCSGNWSFTAIAGEALDEFVQLANRYEEQGVRLQPKDGTIAVAACVHRDNRLLAWLREDGLAYKYSHEKFIPSWLFDLSETATAGFLSRLWATDGRIACSDNGTPSITYCSTSARLADDVRALLRKLGIPSSVACKPAAYRDDVTGELVECRDAYLVRVETREGWRRFMTQCRVPGKPAVPLPKTAECNNRDTIPLDVSPLLATLAATMRGRRGTSLCAAGLRVKPKYPLTYGKARQYLQYFQEHCPAQPRLNELQCLVESDVIWDEIASIEPIGQHACWDVEIETQHNYVLNGLVSHNSTNLASNGVLQANIIPNHKILFVAPLYEQIRRFSNNYVRPFINSSPLKQLWTNTKTENSVLQKTFANGSLMQFTFALLDSSRVRGVSAHELDIDESVKIGTLVATPQGDIPIEQLQPGAAIYGIDNTGRRVVDKVLTVSDHGIRDCYRVEFDNGQSVELTSESFIATPEGWQTVEGLVARIADAGTGTASVGHTAGRRLPGGCGGQPAASVPTRLGATGLQLRQIPGIVRVRTHATQESEEQRLRHVVVRLGDAVATGICSVSAYVLPGRTEAHCDGVVGQAYVGSRRLVVSGRRQLARKSLYIQHPGFSTTRRRTAGRLADAAWYSCDRQTRAGKTTQQNILDRSAGCTSYPETVRPHSAVGRAQHVVQDHAADVPHCADMSLVPATVPVNAGTNRYVSMPPAPDLPGSAVLEKTATGDARKVLVSARQTRGTQRKSARALLRKLGRVTGTGAAKHGRLQSTTPGSREGSKTATSCGETSCTKTAAVGMSTLPAAGAAGRARHAHKILLGVQNAVTPRAASAGVCPTARITRITWAGRHRVFDLTAQANRTFFAGGVAVHNCQDMDPNHIPIIEEVLSASKYKLRKRTGTPKSFDNPMADTYDKGSQAHWQVKCWHCSKYNIASLEHHLLKMIGPIRADISADAPGLICAFCEKPINPRPPWGRWYHEYPSRRLDHSSYHIPQIILPMHYSRRFEWSEVHRKAESYGQARFFNEVLGVPCDFGQRLISSAELRKASDLPWRNNPNSPDPQVWARLPHYEYKVLSIDWGGGGADEVSYTVLTLMGMRPDGVIDVLWGKRMLMSVNHVSEAEETMQWARRFNVDVVIHDYSGAGSLRETFLLQAGMIESRSMPISLVGNLSQDFVRYVPPTAIHGRAYYQLAKTRSLLYMFQALRCGYVHLFQYEDGTQENRSLHEHFLSLVEEKTETRHAGDLYVITRNTKNPDDFAQAVNMGCAGLWYISKRWPDFSRSVRNTSLTAEQEQIIGSNRMGFETDPRNMDELWPG